MRCSPDQLTNLSGGSNNGTSASFSDPRFRFDEITQQWMEYDYDQESWVSRDRGTQTYECRMPIWN